MWRGGGCRQPTEGKVLGVEGDTSEEKGQSAEFKSLHCVATVSEGFSAESMNNRAIGI